MNEPKYIVYLYNKSCFLHLNIINWDTKEIWEEVDSSRRLSLSHIKRLTWKRIEQLLWTSWPYKIVPPDRIPWSREDINLSNTELYTSATLKNIREVIEELEECKLSYMYFVYEPMKSLYMSNNCQSG